MGEQRNLTEENVSELKKHLHNMQQENPDLEYRFFPQTGKEHLPSQEGKEEQPTNRQIFEKLEAIERQLKLIFDGHVLMDGQFKKVGI